MAKTEKSVEILEGNIAKIEVTVPQKEAKDAYLRALKRLSANLNIAGFRKGKAPQNIVEKYVGKERIKTDAIEAIFPQYFAKAVEKENLDIAIQPYIESFDFEEGQDMKMVVKVELKPEVELPKYKELTIKYDEFKTPKDALENELKAIQERFATTAVAVGRNTRADDIVKFDFEGFVGDEPIEHGSGKDYSLDLANSNFIPGFAEGLVDRPIGEEFTIEVTFPEDYHEDKLKGALAHFKCKISEIKEKILPELNDELAKKAGNFENLDALKADIQKYLDENAELENKRRKSEAAFKKVIDEAKIDIQKTMLDREVAAIKSESQQRAAQQGINWDKMVESEGGIEKVNEKLAEEATARIKNSLIIEKIARVEDIKITQEDIMNQINDIARAYGSQAKQVLEQIRQNPSSFTILSQQVANRKVTDILVESNKFSPNSSKKAKSAES